jgi:hypothetical protein
MEAFPRLDIAVTTPGLNIRKTILDYTEENLDRGQHHRNRADISDQAAPRYLQRLRRAHGLQPLEQRRRSRDRRRLSGVGCRLCHWQHLVRGGWLDRH